MYLWHVDKLVDDFRNDNVSEKEKFKYVLLFSVVLTVFPVPMFEDLVTGTIVLTGLLVAVIGGTYYCYISNRDVDDKNFISRFLCIGVPIYVRLLVFSIPIMILIVFVPMESSESDEMMYYTIIGQAIYTVLFCVVYYVYLGSKLKSIAEKKRAKTS